jgi:menaquinone-dependent protoporphyrinogen oxidase
MKTLVAYASKSGATAEIAEQIGAVLRQAGIETDVLRADGVHDLNAYSAVVLGSAVYIGQWRKEAADFLKTNEKVLAERPLWIFSSGPTDAAKPDAFIGDKLLPGGLLPIAERIHPRDVTIFMGAVDLTKMNILERWMIKNVKAPVGDFRDWEAITRWATSIANALKEPVS